MSKQEFLRRVSTISRAGIDTLLAWLDETDFYQAPSSSMFHGNYKGGLVDHLVNVHEELIKLAAFYAPGEYSDESIAVVALFHDLCKVDLYANSTRNVKNELTGVWEKKPFYKKAEVEPFGGHGSKSVYLTMRHIRLTQCEAAAINVHMGPWDKQDYGNPGEVYKTNKLAWMLHVADEASTYFRDRTET